MRDEDDRGARRLQVAQDREQPIDVGRREGRGRLVEDEHPRLDAEGARDLDDLPLGDGEVPHRPPRVDSLAEQREEARRLRPHGAVVDERASRLAAEEDVLRHVEVGDEARILVDHGDAEAAGFGRRASWSPAGPSTRMVPSSGW